MAKKKRTKKPKAQIGRKGEQTRTEREERELEFFCQYKGIKKFSRYLNGGGISVTGVYEIKWGNKRKNKGSIVISNKYKNS